MQLAEHALEKRLSRELNVVLKIAVSQEAATADQLTQAELAAYTQIADSPRSYSWLLGRSALKRLRASWKLSQDTSSITFPNPSYSLTHSGNYAIAAGTRAKNIDGLGVDLELERVPHPDALHFFLRPSEHQWILSLPQPVRSRETLRLWTIKEAVFKADPNNAGRLLANYNLPCPWDHRGHGFADNAPQRKIHYCTIELAQGFFAAAILARAYTC